MSGTNPFRRNGPIEQSSSGPHGASYSAFVVKPEPWIPPIDTGEPGTERLLKSRCSGSRNN